MTPTFRRPVIRAARLFASGLAALAIGAGVVSAQPAEIVVGKTFVTAGDDPARGSNGWALVSHGVAEQLFMVDETGRVTPRLAAGAERSGDRTSRVTLRDGRRFSDGSTV
ncbi:MAG: hypothetical protein ACK5WM_04900, partial [Rhodospirillales bacterium]